MTPMVSHYQYFLSSPNLDQKPSEIYGASITAFEFIKYNIDKNTRPCSYVFLMLQFNIVMLFMFKIFESTNIISYLYNIINLVL